MSILTCLLRLKALFAPALPQQVAPVEITTPPRPLSRSRCGGRTSPKPQRIASAPCHYPGNDGESQKPADRQPRVACARPKRPDPPRGRLAAVTAAGGRPFGGRVGSPC